MPLNEEDNVCRIGDTVDRIFDSAQKENVRREKGIPDGIGPWTERKEKEYIPETPKYKTAIEKAKSKSWQDSSPSKVTAIHRM